MAWQSIDKRRLANWVIMDFKSRKNIFKTRLLLVVKYTKLKFQKTENGNNESTKIMNFSSTLS